MSLCLAFTASAPAERSVGNCSTAKILNFRFSPYLQQDYNVPYTSIGSLYLYTNAGLPASYDTRLCPDLKLNRTTSVEICGRGGLTVTRLMANGGALLNSIMCRVSKEPDIIFLQVGGNDFPRTTRNQRDADAFSLQHRK